MLNRFPNGIGDYGKACDGSIINYHKSNGRGIKNLPTLGIGRKYKIRYIGIPVISLPQY